MGEDCASLRPLLLEGLRRLVLQMRLYQPADGMVVHHDVPTPNLSVELRSRCNHRRDNTGYRNTIIPQRMKRNILGQVVREVPPAASWTWSLYNGHNPH